MRKKIRWAVQILVALTCFGTGAGMAETAFGLRAGATADPDQFQFGGHLVSDPLIGNLDFRPNLEIGIGSHVTTIAANLEFAYRIPLPKSDLSAYVGAGPALLVYRFGESHNRGGGTDTGGGINLLVGLEHEDGLFGELKVGALDSPEIKFTIGFTFR